MTTTTPSDSPARNADQDRRIDYIEWPAKDLAATKQFYSEAFGWRFTDYGPEYTSFEDGRMAGGFFQAEGRSTGWPLVVIFAVDLERTEARVRGAGGTITKPAYSFPGGRRFHFADPNGNVLAVWSDR